MKICLQILFFIKIIFCKCFLGSVFMSYKCAKSTGDRDTFRLNGQPSSLYGKFSQPYNQYPVRAGPCILLVNMCKMLTYWQYTLYDPPYLPPLGHTTGPLAPPPPLTTAGSYLSSPSSSQAPKPPTWVGGHSRRLHPPEVLQCPVAHCSDISLFHSF